MTEPLVSSMESWRRARPAIVPAYQPTAPGVVDSQLWLVDAAEAYRHAKEAYYEAREDVLQNASQADRLRGLMKDAEAEAICNGAATGKNSEERDASLRVYLATNDEAAAWRSARDQLRTYELAKSQAENVADMAANEMSLQKRRMEAHTANVHRAAAIEANAGTERKEIR